MVACNCGYFPFSVTVVELMSLAVSAVSSSKDMGFDENKEGGEKSTNETVEANQEASEEGGRMSRQMSETSMYATEEEDDAASKLALGPQYTIKEQLEKDKVIFCSLETKQKETLFCCKMFLVLLLFPILLLNFFENSG